MKKALLIFITLFLLGACATPIMKESGEPIKWEAQRTSTLPSKREAIAIHPQDLEPGDIMFSAAKGISSFGIRIANFTSVSHAFLYLGDNQIAEAIGGGVNIQTLEQSIKENTLIAVYRHPKITAEHAQKLKQFAEKHEGEKYNFWGIIKQAPFSITRKMCELPVIPREVRYACLSSMAYVQIGHKESERFFCSQFILEGFKQADLSLANAPSEWFNPSDILRMRENDVPPIKTNVELKYVGHLRCRSSLLNGICVYQPATAIKYKADNTNKNSTNND